jgi:hypothetical protein
MPIILHVCVCVCMCVFLSSQSLGSLLFSCRLVVAVGDSDFPTGTTVGLDMEILQIQRAIS